jgi:hypothetical protein
MKETVSDAQLATSLARLWPNREHEAPALAGLLCRMHVHLWRRLDLSHVSIPRDVWFCFWCSKVKIDGVIYDP